MIFQPQQLGQFFLFQFFHAFLHVMCQHEVEESLLLVAEMFVYLSARCDDSLFAADRLHGKSHMRQHVEQVAVLGVYDLLHLA